MTIEDDGHLGLGTCDLNLLAMSLDWRTAKSKEYDAAPKEQREGLGKDDWMRVQMAKTLLQQYQMTDTLFKGHVKIAASYAALSGHRVTFAQPGQMIPVIGVTSHGRKYVGTPK